MTQIAMEVYETNDFKRYGEKIHFFDNIKVGSFFEKMIEKATWRIEGVCFGHQRR